MPYLPVESELAQDYLADLRFVIDFARARRKEMLIRVLECVGEAVPEQGTVDWVRLIDTAEDIVHNFIAAEDYPINPLR